MDEKLYAVICPHPPLSLPNMRNENHFEIDPIGIDPIVYTVVRFDPVSVHITWIGLVRAETSINENILNTSRPKCSDGSQQSLQEPTPTRSGPEPASYFL
jgi:hypothetical protein